MLVRVAALAALGGFLFGYDLGLIGGAMLGISQSFSITSAATKEAIVGAAKLGAFFGTFLGGVLMLRYGRRFAIAFESCFFVAGPLVMAAAGSPSGLIVGRLLVGLGIGASAIVVPTYLAEIAPAAKRGAVVQTYEVMLTLGMLCAGVVDWLLSSTVGPGAWRWMVGLPAAPGALLAASLLLLPESPRWLVLRGQLDLALATLHKIVESSAGSSSSSAADAASNQQALEKAEDELLLLWSSVQKEQAAALMLRQQQQRQAAAAAAALNGGGPAANTLGVGDNGPAAASAAAGAGAAAGRMAAGGGYHPPALPAAGGAGAGAGAGGVVGGAPAAAGADFAPAAAPDDVFTLDDEGGEEGQPQNAAAAGTAAGAAAAGSIAQVSSKHTSSSSSSQEETGLQQQQQQSIDYRNTVSSTDDAEGSQQQQQQRLRHHQQQQWVSREDNQFEQLLNHSHPRSSSSAQPAGGDGTAAAWAPSSSSSRVGLRGQAGQGLGFAARVRSWLRGTVGYQQQQQQQQQQGFRVDGSSNGTPAGAAGQQQQQQQQWCEPGQASNVFASLWAMLCDVVAVVRGPERAAFAIAATLAVFDQATASTAVINYAPEVLSSQLGVTEQGSAILYPAVISVTKCVGVGIALVVVDAWGRKPLLVWGGVGCGVALLCAAGALAVSSVPLFLGCLCLFIFSFSLSWAGLYWVVVSEIFSMGAKSPATSAATSLLFLTGAVVNFMFLSLVSWLGAGAFGVFGAVAFGSAWYVHRAVPETRGKTLVEIQALLASPAAAGSAAQVSGGVVRYGRWRGWDWGRTAVPASAADAAAAAAAAAGAAGTDISNGRGPGEQGDAAAAVNGISGSSNSRPGSSSQAGGLMHQQQQQQGVVQREGGYEDDVEHNGSGYSPYGGQQGNHFWQHWLQRQQQQQQQQGGGGGLMAQPLGLELAAVSGGRRPERRGAGEQAPLMEEHP